MTTDTDTLRGRPRDPQVSRRILAAALTEYSRSGWAAFTMDGVAREAGVGKAALYRRWSSKDKLLLDALEEQASTIPVTEATGDFRNDLVALCSTLMAYFLDPGGWVTLRLAVDCTSDDDSPLPNFHSRIVTAQGESFDAFIEHYVESGVVSKRVRIDTLSDHVYGAVLMHVLKLTPQERRDARAHISEHCEPIVDLVLAGIVE